MGCSDGYSKAAPRALKTSGNGITTFLFDRLQDSHEEQYL